MNYLILIHGDDYDAWSNDSCWPCDDYAMIFLLSWRTLSWTCETLLTTDQNSSLNDAHSHEVDDDVHDDDVDAVLGCDVEIA